MNTILTAAVITASDKGSRGERVDESGELVAKMLTEAGYDVLNRRILPDERRELAAAMLELCDAVDLILTTGGTGFSQRDCMPEATGDVIQREVPGIPEAMRWQSLQITPRAMLSRARAGIRGGTLIVNLPGSPKAVREMLEYILPHLEHGLEILKGSAGECARP